MDDLHDNPAMRARILTHYSVTQDANWTAQKFGVTPEFVVDLADYVVQRIVTLWDEGNSLAEIRRQTGYGKNTIRNTLVRLGKYELKTREMSDPFLHDPPASALVHIPDPQGVYVGFDLLPDEAMRLAKIQIIRRCGVTGPGRREYESSPFEPISPYCKTVRQHKGLDNDKTS